MVMMMTVAEREVAVLEEAHVEERIARDELPEDEGDETGRGDERGHRG